MIIPEDLEVLLLLSAREGHKRMGVRSGTAQYDFRDSGNGEESESESKIDDDRWISHLWERKRTEKGAMDGQVNKLEDVEDNDVARQTKGQSQRVES